MSIVLHLCAFFCKTLQNYYIKLTKDVSVSRKVQKNAEKLTFLHFFSRVTLYIMADVTAEKAILVQKKHKKAHYIGAKCSLYSRWLG
jgi:hypothetical protein